MSWLEICRINHQPSFHRAVIETTHADIAFIIECDQGRHLEDVQLPGYRTVSGALSVVNNKVRIMAYVSTALQAQVRTDIMSGQLSTPKMV